MKVLTRIALIPLLVATAYLAVANRHRVLFNLDPFNVDDPALALEMPLWLIILLAALLGILIGGSAAWVKQGRWRKEARQSRKTVAKLASDTEKPLESLPVPTSKP